MVASGLWQSAALLGPPALHKNWTIRVMADAAAHKSGRRVERIEVSRLEVLEVAAWLRCQEAAEERTRPENLMALARDRASRTDRTG